MTDRPIIFSGPMVRALLDGRKTQTRRLATSPLRNCQVGDRLYVRENWKPHSTFAGLKPRDIPRSNVFYAADEAYAPSNTPWVPSIHMPRWVSRLTLTVTDVRTQQLQEISEADSRSEGITDRGGWWLAVGAHETLAGATAYGAFYCLWNSLHDKPRERWADNPEIVALTFTVERRNIDGVTRKEG